jgi:hypothetical protein
MLKIIIKFNQNLFFRTFFLIFLIFFVSNCSVPNFLKPSKVDSRTTPVNSKERGRQNVETGKGISLGGMVKSSRSTNYEFSTSNPLWRASLELIDFMPLATVDYSGGIIITDWYNDGIDAGESIKITLRFLSTEIRSDSVKIIIHRKKCKINENCKIDEIDSKIKFELQRSILTKASQFKADQKE